jgi:hypothetical protein
MKIFELTTPLDFTALVGFALASSSADAETFSVGEARVISFQAG